MSSDSQQCVYSKWTECKYCWIYIACAVFNVLYRQKQVFLLTHSLHVSCVLGRLGKNNFERIWSRFIVDVHKCINKPRNWLERIHVNCSKIQKNSYLLRMRWSVSCQAWRHCVLLLNNPTKNARNTAAKWCISGRHLIKETRVKKLSGSIFEHSFSCSFPRAYIPLKCLWLKLSRSCLAPTSLRISSTFYLQLGMGKKRIFSSKSIPFNVTVPSKTYQLNAPRTSFILKPFDVVFLKNCKYL